MEHSLTLVTDTLIFRPLSTKDSEQFRLLRNQEENRKWFKHTDLISPEQQQLWFENYLKREDDYMFSLYLPNNCFIGCLGLYDVDMEKKAAEFGRLIIDQKAAGEKHMGRQAVYGACLIAKEQLSLSSLYLEVYDNNVPAIKTYKNAGFSIIRAFLQSDGRKMFYMERSLLDLR